MIGFIDSYEFTNLPTGIIIPWNSSSVVPPTGWSFLTPPNIGVSGFSGCYIMGAGGSTSVGASGIGGTPYGRIQFTSTAAGAHGGYPISVITSKWAQGDYYSTNRRRAEGDSAGSHTHNIWSAPVLGYNQYQFIKATGPAEKIPANGVLLNVTHSDIPWLTQIGTDGKYLRAGNRTATGSTSINAIMYSDDPNYLSGKHVHGWSFWMMPQFGGVNTTECEVIFLAESGGVQYPNLDGQDGFHEHLFNSLILTDNIKKVYTTAWTYASDFYGFKGMIGFWDAALPVPAGWAACDGTNGTIDMREHFIMMSTSTNKGITTGVNTINITAASGNMLASQIFSNRAGGLLSHCHYTPGGTEWPDTPASTNDNVYKNVIHLRENINHDHPGTAGLNLPYRPQWSALYIIQKL